ncbi:hypothetical protein ARMA_1006 [Ardenticatena maritima]|uniref:Uncharacterized protein n=1 Tax=Ardenticatena maritima TaxID=872965 RepID=A0A0M8K657_9CHLR|nr:hypothetical protein ARMA_1006 [Ardenticatena maritima]
MPTVRHGESVPNRFFWYQKKPLSYLLNDVSNQPKGEEACA